MRNRFYLILLSLLLNLPAVRSQEPYAILRGKKADYAGDTIRFLTYGNMITFDEKEIGKCAVDDSGSFECRIPLQETGHVFTYLGIYNCYLYASPGMDHTLRLPSRRDKTPEEAGNPYFDETSIHLSVKSEAILPGSNFPAGHNDLNFNIRAFNDAFYPYYYKFVINAYGQRVDRKEIEKAIGEIRANFDSIPGKFLRTYIDYRIGLLEHYGSQVSNKNISREYFLGKPVYHHNPAYMELFNETYKEFFLAFAEEYPARRLPVVLNRELDFHQAADIIRKEAGLENDTLLELVMIKGLYDGIYDGKNLPPAMIQLLDSLGSSTTVKSHKSIVREIMLEVTKILPGYAPPDFTLFDSDSNLVSLTDLRGNYVYLNFCNSFGYYCVREFEYLRILHERLKDRLVILTILVDDNFKNMQDLVRSNNYPWIFLSASNQPEITQSYDLKTYPYYFLIGPEGKMILSPAPGPLENFEQTFNRIYLGQE